MATAVRVLKPDEWKTFRRVRIDALRTDPDAFESTVSDEEGLPDEHWKTRLPRRVFAFDDGNAVGMVGWVAAEGTTTVQLIGMWVAPDHRGTDVAESLVNEVRRIAQQRDRRLVLSVRADNHRAKRFYERCGFVVTGSDTGFVSGESLEEMLYIPRPT